MSLAMVVALKVISRNVARSQVTSQKMSSNRQNQSSSTGPGRMNFASTLPQTEAEFFDEKGLLKEYNLSTAAAAVPAYRQYVCIKENPRSK